MTMLKVYVRILIVTWRVLGFGRIFLTWLLVEPMFRLFTFLTLGLDYLFFRRFRKVEVKKPVFIIGHPRSGTTHVHHILTQGDNVAAFQMWHLIFPALTARLLMGPVVKLLVKIGQAELVPGWTGHRIALNQTESEEFLFLHNYDTNLAYSGVLSFDERSYPELQYHDQQPEVDRMRSMRFFDGCLKRHIHYTGNSQIIAQTHVSTFRLKTMLKFYTDGKFIFLMRNPHQVVPSYFSLIHNTKIKHLWQATVISPELIQRYNERRFQGMIDLYRYFYDLDVAGELPMDRVMILPYQLLNKDPQAAFTQIAEFTGLTMNEIQKAAIAEQSRKTYKRQHQVNDLAAFGLSHERISKEFAFVFERYGIEDRYE